MCADLFKSSVCMSVLEAMGSHVNANFLVMQSCHDLRSSAQCVWIAVRVNFSREIKSSSTKCCRFSQWQLLSLVTSTSSASLYSVADGAFPDPTSNWGSKSHLTSIHTLK